MRDARTSFIPALGFRFLSPLYDVVLKTTMGDPEFKNLLLEQAELHPGETILDVGCGTGTLTQLASDRMDGRGKVFGMDRDQEILAIASKNCKAGITPVRFCIGSATSIPIQNESVDRVVSSLVFHHLLPAEKIAALHEIRRVLKPGGRLHIVDWGAPASWGMRIAFYAVQCLDGFRTTSQNVQGALPGLIHEAGFSCISILPCRNTAFGSLQCFHASRD